MKRIFMVLLALTMVSCRTIPQHAAPDVASSEQIRWFKQNSMLSDLSRHAIRSMRVYDGREPEFQEFRAVMDLSASDFAYLTQHPFFESWHSSGLPYDVGKHTLAFDGGRGDQFEPASGSRQWWIYISPPQSEAQVPCRLYLIEFGKDNQSWKLHYFYMDH